MEEKVGEIQTENDVENSPDEATRKPAEDFEFSEKLEKALHYVMTKKRGKKRRISSLPEICHSADVLKKAYILGEKDEDVLCAAILHDQEPSEEILIEFGSKCHGILTRIYRGPREYDDPYIERILKQPPEVQLLVICDVFTDISDASVCGALGQARGYFRLMGGLIRKVTSDQNFDRSFREMVIREMKFWERKLRVTIHK